MITADQLRNARIRAGFTSQKALADALGVSERTVTSWEQDGNRVSDRSEARVRALLWPAPEPLSHYSNYELLSEIGRRLDAASQTYNVKPEISQSGDEGDSLPNARTSAEGTAGPHSPPRTPRQKR